MEVVRYAKVIGLILVAIVLLYLIETSFPIFPGIYIGSIEVISELFAAYILLRRLLKIKSGDRSVLIALFCFFIFLAIADTAYVIRFYILHLEAKTLESVLLTKLPYALAFLGSIFVFIKSQKEKLSSVIFSKSGVMSALITLPIATRFVFLPFYLDVSLNGLSPAVFGEGSNIAALFILANLSLITFISARSLRWAIFATGMLSLVLGDWSIRVETLLGATPKFGIYEFLWGFGVILLSSVIFLTRGQLEKIEQISGNSLLNNYKLATALVGFISIVSLCVSQQSSITAIKIIAIGTIAGALVSTLIGHFMVHRIAEFSENIGQLITQSYTSQEQSKTHPPLPLELTEVFQAVFLSRVQDYHRRMSREKETALASAKGEVARQVAHDIRSPLAALNCIVQDLGMLNEDQRLIIRSATSRIRDISNNLLKMQVEEFTSHSAPSELDCQPELVFSLVESLISEKRTQYRSKMGVEIESNISPENYGLFVAVNSSNFKRVLSNLIDNSVESIEQIGKIQILVSSDHDHIKIKVKDNGQGIAPELLSKIAIKGATFGKLGGSGLGLYHAKMAVQSWNGRLEIDSKVGQGTEVLLLLPKAKVPEWFLPELKVSRTSKIIIIDDDISIHETWKRRFEKNGSADLGLSLFHFSNPDEFIRNQESLSTLEKEVYQESTYLIDYELLGSKMSGIDLIEQMNLTQSAILVTSYFEDKLIRKKCEDLGVPLIPKGYAAYVPITVC